jgi:hypothetical protein
MAVLLEPEKMSHDELIEAHRKYDNTGVKQKLYEKHNYSTAQLTQISKGELRPDEEASQ